MTETDDWPVARDAAGAWQAAMASSVSMRYCPRASSTDSLLGMGRPASRQPVSGRKVAPFQTAIHKGGCRRHRRNPISSETRLTSRLR